MHGDPTSDDAQARAWQSDAERAAPTQPSAPAYTGPIPDGPPTVPTPPYGVPPYAPPPYATGYPGAPGVYPPYGPPPAPPPRRGTPWYVWLIGGCLGLALLSCGGCAVLVYALGHAANVAAHETPAASSTTQNFSVSGTPLLDVRDPSGTVTVLAAADTGSVSVQMTKNARDTSATAAQNDLSLIGVSASQNGNTISVVAQFPQRSASGRQLSVDLSITVPVATGITAHLDAGQLRLTGIQGVVDATLGAGSVFAIGVILSDGSRFNISTGALTMVGALADGASANVQIGTGGAVLTLPSTTSTHLDAATSLGNITITGWNLTPTSSGLGASATGDLGTSPSGTLTIRVHLGAIALTATA